jgi:glycosyltransferase involved in cell wall biosynthesis
MYNEAEVLQALFASIQQVMDNLALEYEAICIDDGSTDGTYEALASMDKPHIKAFRFSKNFGKEVVSAAM